MGTSDVVVRAVEVTDHAAIGIRVEDSDGLHLDGVTVGRRSSLHRQDLEYVHAKVGLSVSRSRGLVSRRLAVSAHAKGVVLSGSTVGVALDGYTFVGAPECRAYTRFGCTAISLTFTARPAWWPQPAVFFGALSVALSGAQRYSRADTALLITSSVSSPDNAAIVCVGEGAAFTFGAGMGTGAGAVVVVETAGRGGLAVKAPAVLGVPFAAAGVCGTGSPVATPRTPTPAPATPTPTATVSTAATVAAGRATSAPAATGSPASCGDSLLLFDDFEGTPLGAHPLGWVPQARPDARQMTVTADTGPDAGTNTSAAAGRAGGRGHGKVVAAAGCVWGGNAFTAKTFKCDAASPCAISFYVKAAPGTHLWQGLSNGFAGAHSWTMTAGPRDPTRNDYSDSYVNSLDGYVPRAAQFEIRGDGGQIDFVRPPARTTHPTPPFMERTCRWADEGRKTTSTRIIIPPFLRDRRYATGSWERVSLVYPSADRHDGQHSWYHGEASDGVDKTYQDGNPAMRGHFAAL